MMQYLRALVAVVLIYGFLTAILYPFVRMVFARLPKGLALVVAVTAAQLLPSLRGGLDSFFTWGQFLAIAGILAWLGLRPGRGPTIALLTYYSLVLPLNLYQWTQQWGSPAQLVGAASLSLRLAIIGLLVWELRRPRLQRAPLPP